MKYWHGWAVFLLLLTSYWAKGQVIEEDTSKNSPFFRSKKFDSKCYVGFEGAVGQIMRTQAGMNLGFSLNWVINHQFIVTGKYHVLTTPVNIQSTVATDQPGTTVTLVHNYAGLGFGYILFYNKKFSFQPELSAGWASVKHRLAHGVFRQDFGMIIPAIYGIYNASKLFRFGVGLNYQLSMGCKLNGLKDADLSGIYGLVFMRVGTF